MKNKTNLEKGERYVGTFGKNSRRILSFALAFLMIFSSLPFSVFAEDFSFVQATENENPTESEKAEIVDGGVMPNYADDKIEWSLDSEGTLTLSGDGVLQAYCTYLTAYSDKPWLSSLSNVKVKKLVVSDGITAIYGTYFYNSKVLEEAEIADSVKRMSYLFYGCSNLKNVKLSKSLELIGSDTFNGCSSLESIELPDTLTSVESNAFRHCSSLESVILPDSVETVEHDAFYACSALKELKLSSSLKTLRYNAFSYCSLLESVVIPASVKSIGNHAFDGCRVLNDVKILGEYIILGTGIFNNTAIYSNPDYIKSGCLIIDGCLFYEVEPGATSLYLDESVTGISQSWFGANTKLEEITVCNKNCAYPDVTPNFPTSATIKAPVYSTTQVRANKQNAKYVPICLCGTSEYVDESYGYCDGMVGYTAGDWCENCRLWLSGHEKKYEFSHIDENEDEICDYCGRPIEESVVNVLKVGDDLMAYLMSDGTLYILGSGNMYDFTKKMDIETNDVKVKSVVFSNKVLHIGNYAFAGMKEIKSVTLPPILISIGKNAFSGCAALEKIELTGSKLEIGEYAFNACTALSSVTLDGDVKSVGDYAFRNCTGLKEATIGSVGLGVGVFYNCTNLKKVKYNVIGAIRVEDYQFYGCKNLEEFDVKNGFYTIGDKAFYNCKSLKKANIDDWTYSIGKYAFFGCSGLENVEIPKDIEKLSLGVFKNCTSLKSVKFADRTKNIEIGESAFYGCTSLEDIELDENTTKIYWSAFRECASLKSIVIPESVTSIYSKAFYGCENLEKIEIRNDSIWISGSVTEDKKTYVTIPKTTTVKANMESKGDEYAFDYDMNFEPLSPDITVASCSLVKAPTKTVYKTGSDSKFDPDGAFLAVTYSDGTQRNIKAGYTVDWSNCDLSTDGEYEAVLTYDKYKFTFTVKVASDEIFVGVPESKTFFVYCESYTENYFKFIPEETREYTFCFDTKSRVRVSVNDTLYTGLSGSGYLYIKCTLEAGVEYDFCMDMITSSGYVRVTEVEDLYFTLRDDGTYEAKDIILSNYGDTVTIPAEYGGKPVTAVADDFLYQRYSSKPNPSTVIISEGVKEIGANAFHGYFGTVKIPDSVEKIGKQAFYGVGLTEITLGENLKDVGDEAFAYCKKLKNVKILSSKATFGKDIFTYCTALEDVYVADGVTALGEEMFAYCTALEGFTGAKDLKKIAEAMFVGCTSFVPSSQLLNSVEEIGKRAFSLCTAIKKIKLEGNLKTVRSYAFNNCENLTEIVVTDSLNKVEPYAFAGTGIETFEIPENVENFSINFYCCKNLKEITLPENVTVISESAFSGCTSLESVYTKGTVTRVCNNAFRSCSSLKNVDFFDTVEEIGDEAFIYCSSLKEVVLPKVKIISSRAFESCGRLEKVDISSKGAIIGTSTSTAGVFASCNSLKEVSVAENCTVYSRTFKDCYALETVTFGEGVTLKYDVLDNCSALKDVYIYIVSVSEPDLGNISKDVTLHGYIGSGTQKLAESKGYGFKILEGHSHTFSVVTEEPKRCCQPAYNIYTCECGYTYKEKVIGSEYKHYYADYTIDKNPTCTQPGLKSRHCYCGRNRMDISIVEPYGHTEIIDIPAISPTETTPGYTHKSHCATCGETLVEVTEIARPQYEFEFGEDTVKAEKLDCATSVDDGEFVAVMFMMRNDVCVSEIDKTVIYKVGEVKLSNTEFIYNGKNQQPTVTVKDSIGEKLTCGTDYKLTYPAESKYSGTYSVKVDFIGNYAGSKSLTYTVSLETITPTVSSYTSNSVKLSWKKAKADLSYRVYIVEKNGSLKFVGETKSTGYTVQSLKPGTRYNFCVKTAVKDGSGKLYQSVQSKTVTCLTKPSDSVKLSYTSTSGKVTLSWTKSAGATGYRIYRYDESKKTYVKVKDVTTLSYTVKNLDSGKTYKYAVKPFAKDGSTVSFTAKYNIITVMTAPAKTNITSISSTGGKVTLKWKNVKGESGYQVYYSTKKSSGFKLLSSAKVNKTSLTKKLTKGTTYYFKVRAYKKVDGKTVYGEFSSVKSVKIK